MAKGKSKPLWGFGWAGWCLLVVAAVLLSLMIMGVDVRHWILARITLNLGNEAALWFVGSFLASHGVFDFLFLSLESPISSWIPTMRFSVLTMCAVLIALQVHPRRTGLARITGLVLLGVVIPGLTFPAIHGFTSFFTPAPGVVFDPVPTVFAMTVFSFGSSIVSSAALAWISRSWWIGLYMALGLGFGALVSVEGSRSVPAVSMNPLILAIRGDEQWLRWVSLAWNPATLASMLVWAIHARLRAIPEHCCQSCGYDLRATPTGPCPECGISRTSRPSTPSAAGDVSTS